MEIKFDPAITFAGENLRNAINMSILPGTYSDESRMGMNYTIESTGSESMLYSIKFDDPLFISQTNDPDRILVVIDMANFTRSDGVEV